MTEQKPASRIPTFRNYEEEAEFWDTHDTSDFEEEFKPVRARFSRNLSEGITVRLDPQTLSKLREEAHAQGVGPTTLVRMWIMEHMRSGANGSGQ